MRSRAWQHFNIVLGGPPNSLIQHQRTAAIMSMFRAKKLDIGCYVNIRNIRDHTKRKVFAANEPERYAF
jgi:hypothetical protein